jgi:hypothetical protein
MLDTSVLLTAIDEGRAEHRQALLIFTDWAARGATLYASGQIMREYLAVTTRPGDQNGLGLKQPDAVGTPACCAHEPPCSPRTSGASADSTGRACNVAFSPRAGEKPERPGLAAARHESGRVPAIEQARVEMLYPDT